MDSNPIAERHWAARAERHGLPAADILRSHHGRPSVETVRQFAPHLDTEREARLEETAEADGTDGLAAIHVEAVPVGLALWTA